MPPEALVWSIIKGDGRSDNLREFLGQCLERITYFGRAESPAEQIRRDVRLRYTTPVVGPI